MSEKKPVIGVGVFVYKGSRFLIGKRVGNHGSNSWSLPGGHLEYGESIEACAEREVFEETGLKIKDLEIAAATSDIFKDKHYVTIFVKSSYLDGRPLVKEREKIIEWKWITKEDLPENLFLPLQNYFESNQNLFYSA